jgi:hypothetical protein
LGHGFCSFVFHRFFALGGERIDRKRSARSARVFGRNKGACDRVRKAGHAGYVANYDRPPPREKMLLEGLGGGAVSFRV